MSPFASILIDEGGLNREIVILLIFLPFLSSIIGIARHYIGIKTFNLYAPILLTSSFFLLSTRIESSTGGKIIYGAGLGIIFSTVALISSILVNTLFRKIRMHYFPKLSLVLSSVWISLTICLFIIQYIEFFELKNINIIGVILIALASEFFVNTLIKKKLKNSIPMIFETLLLSLLCYLILSIKPFQDVLLTYPQVVLLSIPINYIIGRYTGLRLKEYLRFSDILNEKEDTDEPV